jgi:hypothetical protein
MASKAKLQPSGLLRRFWRLFRLFMQAKYIASFRRAVGTFRRAVGTFVYVEGRPSIGSPASFQALMPSDMT